MSPESLVKLNDSLKSLDINTANKLKGSDRRQFMAEVVKGLGTGGASLAERELGWNRRTIRKGKQELETGAIADLFHQRGRKPTEQRLPNLLADIISIVEPHSQTDPSFESTRLYTRLSAAQVRHQLIVTKGYRDEELPSGEVIRQRLNQLGYGLKKVAKTKPLKQIPETGEIFQTVNQINQQADLEPQTLRISLDAKVGIKLGEFDRGGKTRIPTIALDHDFSSCATLTPYGILLPLEGELFLFFVESKLTADCIVDILEQWWLSVKHRFASSLTFKGKNPVVTLIKQAYKTGVKLTRSAMATVEQQLARLPHLGKWFVEIFARSD